MHKCALWHRGAQEVSSRFDRFEVSTEDAYAGPIYVERQVPDGRLLLRRWIARIVCECELPQLDSSCLTITGNFGENIAGPTIYNPDTSRTLRYLVLLRRVGHSVTVNLAHGAVTKLMPPKPKPLKTRSRHRVLNLMMNARIVTLPLDVATVCWCCERGPKGAPGNAEWDLPIPQKNS